MSTKVEVAKIELKIGDKVISLKPEQAKELKKLLNDMFEESHDHHHWYWHYQPYYSQPYPVTSPYPWWGVTYSGNIGSYQGNNIGSYQGNIQDIGNSLSGQTVCLALNAA